MERLVHPMIKHRMKKLFVLCMCLLGLYGTLFPQAATETLIASPTAAATAANPVATPASTPAPRATPNNGQSDLADKIHRKLEKRLGHKHGIVIDASNEDGEHEHHNEDIPSMVIPLVGIVFMTIFGAPVLIVMV